MILAITNQKGGTGKTTTAINVAKAMVDQGANVLLIDADPQMNLSFAMGLKDYEAGITEWLNENGEIDVVQNREGIDIIPGQKQLVDLENKLRVSEEGVYAIRRALQKTYGYSHIIIDSPSGISLLVEMILCASEKVLIPVVLEVLSIHGLNHILNSIYTVKACYNAELEIIGVLPVKYNRSINLGKELIAYIKNNYQVKVFEDCIISTSIKAAEAPSFGKSLITYSPKSRCASDYIKFSNVLLTNEEKNGNRKQFKTGRRSEDEAC